MAKPDCSRRHFLQHTAMLASLPLLAGTGARMALAASTVTPRPGEWWPDTGFLADLPRLMRACGVPGVAFAGVSAGQLHAAHASGVASVVELIPSTTPSTTATPSATTSNTSLDTRAVFEAASLSKPVFAWLVLKLIDDGLFDIDTPLVSVLRPDWLVAHPDTDRITARHVLTHSSGFINWREKPAQEKLAPAFTPGSRVRYSGEAFFWLQLVVEQLANASLDALAQRLLFAPAGMHSSSFTWNADLAARSVYGHASTLDAPATDLPRQPFRATWQLLQPLAERWQKPLSQWRYADAERACKALQGQPGSEGLVNWPGDLMANAAASLRCTAEDYARFLAVTLLPARDNTAMPVSVVAPGEKTTAQGENNISPREVADPRLQLSARSRALFLQPQIETRREWTSKSCGWNLEQTRQGPVFWHGGNNGNIFKTFALGDPERQRALVVMTNARGGSELYPFIVRAATQLDLLAFAG